jgi:hypothetical protein
MIVLSWFVFVFALAAALVYASLGNEIYTDPYTRGIHHTLWAVLVLISLVVAAHYVRVFGVTKKRALPATIILSMPIVAAVGASMVWIAKEDRTSSAPTNIAGHAWISVHALLVAVLVTRNS